MIAKKNIFWDYDKINEILKNELVPAFIVNLDALENNISIIEKYSTKFNKKIRIATKSIRVPEIVLNILQQYPKIFNGIMCYSIFEAKYYFEHGISDILMGYPIVQSQEMKCLSELISRGANLKVMVDHPEHLNIIEKFWISNNLTTKVKICFDIDCAINFLGIKVGVYRSSISNVNSLKNRLNLIKGSKIFELVGLMGYEAQVAGLCDENPYFPISILNFIKKWLRKRSMNQLKVKRLEMRKLVEALGYRLEFFNGGGSGSLQLTVHEDAIDEITVGSGLLQAQLFDYYSNNEFVPASCFALRITRNPQENILTCQSGGFVASGEVGFDKSPKPFMPENIELIKNEGVGEVQTPIVNKSKYKLNIGDLVFFRSAKSGEIAERFNKYILIKNGKIEKEVLTYRGLNFNFY